MLGDAGNIASLVGVAVGFPALVFAIVQLRGLKGEAKAAREAAEVTRRTVSRDLARVELGRVNERIDSLKAMHRRHEWNQVHSLYSEIRRGLVRIRSEYPDLTEPDSEQIQLGHSLLRNMEEAVDSSDGIILGERVGEFNKHLTDIQSTLDNLESLQQESR